MIHRPLLALGATTLLAVLTCAAPAKAQPVPSAAQPSPTAPMPLPAPNAAPPGPGTAPPGGTWGTELPGAPPPYPPQTPGYGPGAVPPGSPLPAGPAPNSPAPNGSAPPPFPAGAYQPGSVWLSPNNDPMLMGPDGALHQMPLEMPYDPEKGIPPGYKLFEKPRTKLAITGGSIFAGLWIASCFAGGIMESDDQKQNEYYAQNVQYYGYYDPNHQDLHAWPLFLPVLGPFITIGTQHSDGFGTAVLILDGVGQAAMGAMFIAGLVAKEKTLKFQLGPSEVALHPMAAPTAGGGFAGVLASF